MVRGTFLSLVLGAVLVAVYAAPNAAVEEVRVASAAAAASAVGAPEEVPEAAAAVLESSPALRVRMPASSTRAGCTDSGCYWLCVSLNWSGGFCLDEDWCLCYR